MRIVKTAAIALCIACSGTAPAAERPETAPVGSWGVDLSDQDRSIRPGDDFAMFENGAWFKRTVLSAQQANAAYWRDVRVDAGKRVNQMLADLAAGAPERLSNVETMVAAFHRSAMDNDAIDRAGLVAATARAWRNPIGIHPHPIRKADGIDRGTGHRSPADCPGRARPRPLFANRRRRPRRSSALRALCRPGRPHPSGSRILYRSGIRRPPLELSQLCRRNAAADRLERSRTERRRHRRARDRDRQRQLLARSAARSGEDLSPDHARAAREIRARLPLGELSSRRGRPGWYPARDRCSGCHP